VRERLAPAIQRQQARGIFCAFVVAEAFKMRRSRAAKAALIAMAITPVVTIAIVWGMETSFKVFPQVIRAVGASLWLLTGLTTMVLTASSLGNEYEQGTLRVALGRGTPRWLFIVGKAVVLLGATLLNALAAWLSGSVAAILSHLSHAGTEGLAEGIHAVLTSGLAAVGMVLLAAGAYTGLVMALAVLFRSVAFATFGALGLFAADFVLGEAAIVPGLAEVDIGAFSILSDTNLLLNQLPVALGVDWTLSGHRGTQVGSAAFALACYAIGGIVLACLMFRRQDQIAR
jgi:ABC-type transport system involved in multi-copper enzyme maturation permease subunit